MSILPHSLTFFESVGLLLRSDSETPDPSEVEWEMSASAAVRYVRAVGEFIDRNRNEPIRYFPRLTSVGLLGGEPLIHPAPLKNILDIAIGHTMAAEVWTSGSWVRSAQHEIDTIAPHKGRIHLLRLHTSAILAARIGMQRLEWLIEGAHAAGVAVRINCLVGSGLSFPRALLGLPTVNSNSSFLAISPMYPTPAEQLSSRQGRSDVGGPIVARRRCADKFGFLSVPMATRIPACRLRVYQH